MLYYMAEELFRPFPWFQRGLNSLETAARRKRMKLTEVDSVAAIPPEDREAVLVLFGSSEYWMERSIHEAAARNVYPIAAGNRCKRGSTVPYSSISSDIYASVNAAINYMRGIGCHRLALYGVNEAATSDPFLRDAFCRFGGGSAGDTFVLRTNFAALYRDFSARMGAYDGVICTNDYAAASLMQNFRKANLPREQWPKVMGFGDMDICSFFRPTITSISNVHDFFGEAALMIYQMALRNPHISSIDVMLGNQLHVRESTGGLEPASASASPDMNAAYRANLFFADADINRLRRIELLFNRCDELDLEILRHLEEDRSYADISELCYLSETAVKYRVHNMCRLCDIKSRDELRDLLREISWPRVPTPGAEA